jgi:superfamily II DNA/RNA helicase
MLMRYFFLFDTTTILGVCRLKDFVDKGRVDFSAVKFFVLDEADRMLDMGFAPDITAFAK